MVSICRICLNNISSEDTKSKRLIDVYSNYKPQQGVRNITFSEIVSSCLPNLKLHVPIYGIPKICGSCNTKISELYDLKQRSVEVERILLHYIKFHNNCDRYETHIQPIKLTDVASMYNSVFMNKSTEVVLTDLVKQLFSASVNQDIRSEKAEGLQPNKIATYATNLSTTNNLETIGRNKDSVILIVEESSNNNKTHNLKQEMCYNTSDRIPTLKLNAKDSTEVSAEAWFKMSQTNLLPKDINTNNLCQINKEGVMTNNGQKSSIEPMVSQNGTVLPEILKHNTNNQGSVTDTSIETLGNTNTKPIRKITPSTVKKSVMARNLPQKTWNLRSNKWLVPIPAIPQFVIDFEVEKHKKKLSPKFRINNEKDRTNNSIKIKSQKEILRKQLNNNIQHNVKPTTNWLPMEEENETINSEPDENIKNETLTNEDENEFEHEKSSLASHFNHKCKTCEISFENANELQVHLCCTTTVQCEICNVLFPNVNQWTKHKCNTASHNSSNSKRLVVRQENETQAINQGPLEQPQFEETLSVSESSSPMDTSNYITCEICDMEFLTKADLSDHVAESHVSINEIRPRVPNMIQMPHRQSLCLDTTSQANVQKINCNQCAQSFASESLLMAHWELHNNRSEQELFHCDECGKEFPYAYLLRQHKRNHSPRQCPICNETFILTYTLHAHMLSHSWNMSEVVEQSTDPLSTSPNIDQEKIITPPVSPSLTNTSPISPISINASNMSSNSNISLPICRIYDRNPIIIGQMSPNSQPLPQMLEPISSTNERNYRCDKCGELFKSKDDLELHGQTHLINIKFECPDCHKVFPSRPAFRTHQNANCSKLFDTNAGTLQSIQKQIGNTMFTKRAESSRLYQCRLCHKKFISQKFLTDHFRTHVRATQMPQCKYCKVVFANIHTLKRHTALKHNEERQE